MKNQITLNEDTIIKLQQLYNQIDRESKKPPLECNIDVVTVNQFKILDTIKEIIFSDETTNEPKIPTVNLKIALYEYDDDDNKVPLEGEILEDTISDITSVDEVGGYCVTDYEVTYE